jgi:phosphate transport system substrate-binding protein
MALAAMSSYLLWKNLTPPATVANKLSRTSDIHLYHSMREVPNVPKGLFNYGGAAAFAAMTAHGMHTAIANSHPQFQLRYTEPLNARPGSITGIKMFLDGELSFAQNGRPLQDEEYSKAKSRGFTLEQIPVAIDGIVFFTHRDLPVTQLSINQLQDIFRGKIINWKQVGGPNLPIVLISQDPKVSAMLKLLLGDPVKELSPNARIARDNSTAIRSVAAAPGGISYSSASIAIGQESIHSLSLAKPYSKEYIPPFTQQGRVNLDAIRKGTYPLTRHLFIVIRRDGTPDEQAGVAYSNLLLSDEGQKIVEEAGFVPLR